ncbi:MAG: hypothetical protein AB7V42_05770 [Thermoleophilia bacterium]
MSLRLEVTAGGAPRPAQLAALTAAATALLAAAAPGPADPRPATYRSRWRRAAMLDDIEVPAGAEDDGPAWGGTA